MKKIAFLIMNISNGGGTERVTSIIANGLSEKNYEITIISCQNGEVSEFEINEKVNLLSLHGELHKNYFLRKIKTFKSLKKLCIEKRFDLLVAVDVALYVYLYPLKKKKKCKCIAWEHFNYYYSPSFLVNIGRRLAVKTADKVVLLGKNDLRNYKEHYKKASNLTYIYNPNALKIKENCKIKNHSIIAVGRLEKQKGFDLLIDIWKEIENKNPSWKLNIFGDGSEKENLQLKINEYNLKNIHLKGYSKNIDQEFINSSIFVLTSRFEGFGLVLIEAQAKGLPCVSFKCKEGPEEIIDDGINGFLIENGNIRKFVEKLQLLMNNEELRISFSEKSRKDLNRFDKKNIICEWVDLIESV